MYKYMDKDNASVTDFRVYILFVLKNKIERRIISWRFRPFIVWVSKAFFVCYLYSMYFYTNREK